jgi:hypothetical protein
MQPSGDDGLDISMGNCRIHLTGNSSMKLLGSVLRVLGECHVK